MPRELFDDVTDPSITLGTRKWFRRPALDLHANATQRRAGRRDMIATVHFRWH